jgi:hypothetical protein
VPIDEINYERSRGSSSNGMETILLSKRVQAKSVPVQSNFSFTAPVLIVEPTQEGSHLRNMILLFVLSFPLSLDASVSSSSKDEPSDESFGLRMNRNLGRLVMLLRTLFTCRFNAVDHEKK